MDIKLQLACGLPKRSHMGSSLSSSVMCCQCSTAHLGSIVLRTLTTRTSPFVFSLNTSLPICPEAMSSSIRGCMNVQINSQQDVGSLHSCGTITGDVLISRSTAGPTTLTGVSNITGSLQSAPCPSNACDGPTGLSSPNAPASRREHRLRDSDGLHRDRSCCQDSRAPI